MPTLRSPKIDNFTVVPNALLYDQRLSMEARWLMLYLLSKPDDWQVRLHDLMASGGVGEYSARRVLGELVGCGYLRRTRIRRPDGTFYWNTTVIEQPGGHEGEPEAVEQPASGGSTTSGSPVDGSSTSGSPTSGSSTRGSSAPRLSVAGSAVDGSPTSGSSRSGSSTSGLSTCGSSTSGSSTCGKPRHILNTESLKTELPRTESTNHQPPRTEPPRIELPSTESTNHQPPNNAQPEEQSPATHGLVVVDPFGIRHKLQPEPRAQEHPEESPLGPSATVLEAFERGLEMLTPAGRGLLGTLERTYSTAWLVEAIGRAGDARRLGEIEHPVGFVRRILVGWKQEGRIVPGQEKMAAPAAT